MHPDFHWIGKSSDGLTVTLHKFTGKFSIASYVTPEWIDSNQDKIRTGVVVDTETTGLNKKSDTVIEIALRPFRFNRANGDLVEVLAPYTALQDPGRPLSDDVKRLTGLTDAALAGKSIDWNEVNRILNESQLIIAHNAGFDRPFIESKSTASSSRVWGCSFKQIDWQKKGFSISKLEVLSIYHGFFADSHRALSDVDALLNLLTQSDWTTHKTYLNELLTNARRPLVRMLATNSPFETKDQLKERGYNWDSNNRVWLKMIYQDDLTNEVSWMESAIYKGEFRGKYEEIPIQDNFKA